MKNPMKSQHFDPIPNAILDADDPAEAALNTLQAAVDFACKYAKGHHLPQGYQDQMQHAIDYLGAYIAHCDLVGKPPEGGK